MIKQLCSIFILCFLVISNAQSKTYIRDYTYEASEADSKLSSRTIALDQVKVLLLQEIGTHIRQKISISKTSTGKSFSSDDIEAITAGLTRVNILQEKWNGETYYLKAEIDANTDRVLNALEEFKKDNSEESQKHLEAMRANQIALKKSREEIAELRHQLETAKTQAQKQKVMSSYSQKVDEISASDMVSKGYDSEQEGDYEEALYWYRKAARQGYKVGQYNLGVFYERGKGITKDLNLSVKWYKKAAAQDYPNALYNLGVFYERGIGVEKDVHMAVDYYRDAASQDYPNAIYNLGVFYERGRGVRENKRKAAELYQRAADLDYPNAIYNLGVFYERGTGVTKDPSRAAKLYQQAADMDYPNAQYNLAVFYERGLGGLSKDLYEAVHWYKKSANQDYASGQYNLGVFYDNGWGGLTKSNKKAKELYRKACDNGKEHACQYM